MPGYDTVWQLSQDQKRAVYDHKDGSRQTSPGMVGGAAVVMPKPANRTEPVFYGSLPTHFWQELLHSFNVRAAIDLSAGSGEVCKAALTQRKPVLALTLSEAHSTLLIDHLVGWMLEAMQDKNNTYYNVEYATWLGKNKGPVQGGTRATDPSPATEPAERPHTESGKKRKLRRCSSSSSSD
jgi:hypothetical protein